MIGITLDADQIRNAPAPVRQWIEQQVSASFGLIQEPTSLPHSPHLTACTEEQAAALLNQIRGVPAAIGVFFEFGRPGISYGEPPIMAFRLIDIQHHTGLENMTRLMECLELINNSFAELCKDPDARFCGFDNEGHCLIPPASQRSIATLWQNIIAAQGGKADMQTAAA